jgi:hypothetical protein
LEGGLALREGRLGINARDATRLTCGRLLKKRKTGASRKWKPKKDTERSNQKD